MPDFDLGLNASGSFSQGASIANQIIQNRLNQQQFDLQKQEYQRKIEQQNAFQQLSVEAFDKPDLILPQLYARDPDAATKISQGIQQRYDSQYNTLKLLIDAKAENKQATYDLLKPELQRQFPKLQFGDKYSIELNSSLKNQASAIKAKMKTNLEFRDTAQGIVGFNPQTGEGTETGFSPRAYASDGSASGGATGAIVRQIMKDTGSTFTQALQLYQTGFRSNTMIDKEGNVRVMPGGASTKTEIKQAEKLGTDLGEGQAKALLNLGNIEDNSSFLLGQLNEIVKHPGLKGAVGLKGGGALFGNIGSNKIVPGSPEAGFIARMKQIEGQAFLQAFDTLRGGGQITEKEGEKATQARLRMSAATSEKEFVEAVEEFADIVKTGLERQKRQARGEFGTKIKINSNSEPQSKSNNTNGIKFIGFE